VSYCLIRVEEVRAHEKLKIQWWEDSQHNTIRGVAWLHGSMVASHHGTPSRVQTSTGNPTLSALSSFYKCKRRYSHLRLSAYDDMIDHS
jgi:hypothetical protein